MPIYEYDCQKCGTFETTQKITDKPLAKCPTCKGKVKKLISNTSFQLKGTGWYATDFKSTGKKPADKKPGASKESNTESKPETKTDTKPDNKSESKSETKAAA